MVANQDREPGSDTLLNFYINWTFKQMSHAYSSNEVPFQNYLAIGGLAHKLYIHTQALEFYQCGTNSTFIFQHLVL